MVIGPASERDLPDILSLLGQHRLPLAGVREHVETMLVARDGWRVVGTAAVELYGEGALLRSVAVDPVFQGQGIGHRLMEAALDLARRRGAGHVFLLTTTAEGFFPRFGFEPVSRADVPPSVQQSIEFQSACPASAVVMRTRLPVRTDRATRARRFIAEGLGTAFLLAAVVGSGVMAERLAGGNVALALLANAVATGAALIALILTFGPVSGAHFNPAVTLSAAWQRALAWRDVPGYVGVQVAGAVGGVWVAHLMFGLPVLMVSTHARSGPAQVFSEFVATFGLLAVIWGCSRKRADSVPFAVAAYITAAYWFTASTSFANPAVTMARALTDTFAGIRPADVPGFMAAQFAGAFAATLLFGWLVPQDGARS
jgi:glycerol uptake facilitator-like aquaporin/N-acetylglutamate synthase-like GNAT family acetyltransferase